MATSSAPVKTPARLPDTAWQWLYGRAAMLAGVGIILFFGVTPQSELLAGILVVLLFVSGLCARQFWRISNRANSPDYWFLIAALLDLAAAIGFLFYLGNPAKGVYNVLGAWGVLVGITQAVATMYTFLGVKDNSESGQDMSVVILHFVNALLGGGFAFTLIQQPEAGQSFIFAGIFPLGMAVLLVVLTRRLKADADLDRQIETKGSSN